MKKSCVYGPESTSIVIGTAYINQHEKTGARVDDKKGYLI